MSIEARQQILEALAPGIAHYYDLAFASGVLAARGDPMGALDLLGGETEARDLIGDKETDRLIAEASQQMTEDL